MLATLASLSLFLTTGSLHPCLDAASWNERERATCWLAKGGRVVFRYDSEEVKARCRMAQALQQRTVWEASGRREREIEAKALKMFPKGWRQHPWLDRSVLEDDTLYYAIMNTDIYAYYTRKEMESCPWNAWRYATYLWVKHALRAGKSDAWIQRKLDVLAWAEYDWIKNEQSNENFARDYGGIMPLPLPPHAPRPSSQESNSIEL